MGLRAIDRGDLALLLDWRNRPALRRYFREHRELSVTHQENWYTNTAVADPQTRMFAIVDIQTDDLLGACGLCWIDWINRSADFSLYIGRNESYVDETFAPDAGRKMLQYAFGELGLHRVWCELYDFDAAKASLLTTLGFTVDGRHRETHFTDGTWHDSVFYGILDREFDLVHLP